MHGRSICNPQLVRPLVSANGQRVEQEDLEDSKFKIHGYFACVMLTSFYLQLLVYSERSGNKDNEEARVLKWCFFFFFEHLPLCGLSHCTIKSFFLFPLLPFMFSVGFDSLSNEVSSSLRPLLCVALLCVV
jgi:hypothetical protein